MHRVSTRPYRQWIKTLFLSIALLYQTSAEYWIGTGIYDITGPAAQINFMGYAQTSQVGHGIHLRLRSRAYIVAEYASSSEDVESSRRDEESTIDPDTAICFVSIDTGMGSDLVTSRVLKRFKELSSEEEPICRLENTAISGTHTHSAPAGFLQYVLYQITSLGFSTETFDTIVEGVAQSLYRAYQNLEKGGITYASGMLWNANINRSPTSYLLNPESERSEYEDQGDTDKEMFLLKFTTENDVDVGALNWFAVHGTSMNNTNTLISGDNKGYASYQMEKYFNGNDTLPGKGTFVAAFASTNLGDVSPNINGTICIDTGDLCDEEHSSCHGRSQKCIAFGPGKDMFESTEIVGQRQYEHAMSLFGNATEGIEGSVGYRHSFVDMAKQEVVDDDGEVIGKTCSAALGYSFAAGTTDGPGDFDFVQGTNTSNPFWNMISGFLSKPTQEEKDCHAPKPILLNTGDIITPYAWDPPTVPISVFQIGQLLILNVPCEFTTMAGRRMRQTITNLVQEEFGEEVLVVIAGLTNSYAHYVTTYEEYQGQRYEAASTLYGPYTLQAYIQNFVRITRDLYQGSDSESDEAPKDMYDKQISMIPPVEIDLIEFGKKFGAVYKDAHDRYIAGQDKVSVSFHSANPRNNQRIEDTFLTVDFLEQDNTWTTKYVDGDWCTRFRWEGGLGHLDVSHAHMTWEIPSDVEEGTYRICHYGTRKAYFLGDFAHDTASRYLPSAMSWNGFGSFFVGMASQVYNYAKDLPFYQSSTFESIGKKKKDFSGCSKSFQVSVQA